MEFVGAIVVIGIIVVILKMDNTEKLHVSSRPTQTEKISGAPAKNDIQTELRNKPLPQKIYIKSTKQWIDLPPQKECAFTLLPTNEDMQREAQEWFDRQTPEIKENILETRKMLDLDFESARQKRYIQQANDAIREGRDWKVYGELIREGRLKKWT